MEIFLWQEENMCTIALHNDVGYMFVVSTSIRLMIVLKVELCYLAFLVGGEDPLIE